MSTVNGRGQDQGGAGLPNGAGVRGGWRTRSHHLPQRAVVTDADIRGCQVVVGAIPAPPLSFQPRAELAADLAEAASEQVAVVCTPTGQRGMGKTQLAAAYARQRITERWPLVGWVNAGTPDMVLAGLDAVAWALGLRREGEDAATGLSRLMSELRTRTEPALLVFDNVVDPDHVAAHLPETGATQVVLTGTDQAVRDLGRTVSVEVYTPGEAVEYLRDATTLDDEEGAAELAAGLGRLPLALAFAAAVIRNRAISYGDCVRLIRDCPPPEYLAHQPGRLPPHGAAEAILLSLRDTRADTDPGLAQLAGVLALLSPDGVPRLLLVALTDGDIALLDDGIERLTRGSVITLTADRSAVVMHRLVARVIRERSRADNSLATLLATTVTILEEAMFDKAQAWTRRHDGDQLIQQINVVWEHADLTAAPPVSDELIWDLLGLRHWSVHQLRGTESLDRAISLGSASLADSVRLLGDDHVGTRASGHNLALAYMSAGRFDEAIPLFEQTLAADRRLLGDEDPTTLSSENSLACAYGAAGRLGEAIPMCEQVLAARRRSLGDEHPAALDSSYNLAYLYQDAGRLDEAVPLYEQILAARRRSLGDEHFDTLTSGNDLAGVYRAVGRLGEAVPLYEQTLAECRRLLGDEHPATSTVAENLEQAREAQGTSSRRPWWRRWGG